MMLLARSTRRGKALRMVASSGRAWRPPIVGVALLFLATFAFAPVAVAGTSPQGGSETFDVYRPGVYSEQATWTWCTAASVQIMRNILLAGADHSSAHQQQFFDYMRAGNRYQLADHRGVDPQGFLAGLRHFVSPGYALVASPTFDAAVRSAVTQLRLTGKPVALIVAAGRHAWVLTGFTATADPARTTAFQVVSVRIVGPLYGRQSINGYDSPPDTSISYAALRRFLLPYRFPFAVTPWTGRYLTFQAIPTTATAGVAPLAL
jgi:hypothetical protein